MITRMIIVALLNLGIKLAAVYAAYVVFGAWIVVAWFFVQWTLNYMAMDDAAKLCEEVMRER